MGESTDANQTRCLVTGGSGFLGRRLVESLLDSGTYDVTVFDIRDMNDARVKMILGDLRKLDEVLSACAGQDVVFHCATASLQGNNATKQQLMREVNVTGTQNVIDACVEHKVSKIVYTSSASVVFDGRDLVKVDETLPYASRALDFYTATKIEGEKRVLEANGRGGVLATVALRPSGIFGEGDPVLVPTAVEKAKQGKLKYIIGSGENLNDWTYVGNVAQAHMQAAAALDGPEGALAGKPYFITNDDPRPFWGFMGDLVEPLGYERPHIKLPFWLVFTLAVIVEFFIMLLRPLKELSTDFTVFRIMVSTAERQFCMDAARRDFGYSPQVSVDEALQRTIQHFQHLRNDALHPDAKSD